LPKYRDAASAAAARRLLDVLAAAPDAGARRAAVARAFRVVQVREPVLLTAYYEPELDGRLERDAVYRHPLYARPPDLVDVDPHALGGGSRCRKLAGRVEGGRLVPYLSRGEIDGGALDGRGLELAWAADPLALFMLHVQGSGSLRLPDGRQVGLRFAATNGRPYQSLGRTLLARGLLTPNHTALSDIRRALAALPAREQAALFATNERYTFFRVSAAGTVGSMGVELTPGRSIATDPRLVRPGALVYLATPSVHRFAVAQDAGAAIVGAHADLFLGAGPEAEAAAGRMRERGTMYVLLPAS
jgi:membrane-bound lytic murein transglycosylase A